MDMVERTQRKDDMVSQEAGGGWTKSKLLEPVLSNHLSKAHSQRPKDLPPDPAWDTTEVSHAFPFSSDSHQLRTWDLTIHRREGAIPQAHLSRFGFLM